MVGPQKNVVLILAREFASKLATPVFLADGDGGLVYYNEPAEEILGRTFGEAGEMHANDWTSLFSIEHLDGRPMHLSELASGVALLERRPAHGQIRMIGLDGRRRRVSVTALPLFAHLNELVGMIALFWELPDDDSDG
jgi:PAS domain-containing protein